MQDESLKALERMRHYVHISRFSEGDCEVDTKHPEVSPTFDDLRTLLAQLEEREKLLREARDDIDAYASFIRNWVKPKDLEMHPYQPGLEDLVARINAALSTRENPHG